MKLELKKVEDPINKAIEKLKEEILLQLNIAFEAGMEHVLESKEKEHEYDPNTITATIYCEPGNIDRHLNFETSSMVYCQYCYQETKEQVKQLEVGLKELEGMRLILIKHFPDIGLLGDLDDKLKALKEKE